MGKFCRIRVSEMNEAIASLPHAKGDRPNSNYSSRLRRGKCCWKSWEGMNEQSRN
ncbi:MAG TPA: hypothetical protein V6D43_03835 [Candidatus Sericytochromatia bacterium]